MKRPTATELIVQSAVAGDVVETNHECSFWLRSEVEKRFHPDTFEAMPTCGHLWGDEVIVLALWGGPVCCVACTGQLETIGDLDECDRCGRLSDTTIMCTVAAGPLIVVVFMLCEGCRNRESGQAR